MAINKKKTNKGKNNPFYGRRHSKESLEKMRNPRKNRPNKSEAHKRKISEANKGRIFSEETRKKLRERSAVGRPEVRKKISNSLKGVNAGKNNPFYGKHHSEQTKMEMRRKRRNIISPVKDTSIEVKVQDFLKQLGIKFLTHQYMKINHGYQCDIFIPSMNIVIECDGDYWHGNPDFFKGEKVTGKMIKQREKDECRTKELIEKGYNVLRLWEHEIRSMNMDEFLNRLSSQSPITLK